MIKRYLWWLRVKSRLSPSRQFFRVVSSESSRTRLRVTSRQARVASCQASGHLAPVFRFIIQLLWSTKQLISCVLCIQYRDNVGSYTCSNVVIQNPADLCEYRCYLFPKGRRTRARVRFLICEKSFTRSRFLAKYGLQLDINYPLSEKNVLLTVTHRNMFTFTHGV